jgi:DNA-binding transcriptional MerR regulator/mannose-6-phosphate isomerase-like protein (cupin superfamily)
VRHIGGQDFHTISEAAAIAGVSPQTLRVWEAKSLLNPDRTSGRQRLYNADAVKRACDIAQLRQQQGWNPAAIATALAGRAHDSSPERPPRNGARVREARTARGITIKELAGRVGISPAALSALERGEAAVSSAIIARIADALLVPMSALASSKAPEEVILRAGEGPTTVNQGGVTWQELGAPGHDLEPAILTVPPGEGSGGSYSRAGETFVLLQEGALAFTIWSPEPRAIELGPGDALTIPARARLQWHNPGPLSSRALWVESLIGLSHDRGRRTSAPARDCRRQ